MRVLDVFSKKATVMLGLSFALAALPATEAEAQTACHNQTDTLRVYGCKPKAHVVMDVQSGQILMAHEPQRRVQPASTTKIMTMMLAFDAIREGRLQVDLFGECGTATRDQSEYPRGGTNHIGPGAESAGGAFGQ